MKRSTELPSTLPSAYDAAAVSIYCEGAPHLKHRRLRRMFVDFLLQTLPDGVSAPAVLDLGAGDGDATGELLRAGADVTAVDNSAAMLEVLSRRCVKYAGRLTVVESDALQFAKHCGRTFDMACSISFLHHVPDYITFLRDVVRLIRPGGSFFSFADPMRYDTQSRAHRLAAVLSHDLWRLTRGDVVDGALRRLRRLRGHYSPTTAADNIEYHVVRNGVDEAAIAGLLGRDFANVRIIPYWSTEGGMFQALGTAAGFASSFGISAKGRRPFAGEGPH